MTGCSEDRLDRIDQSFNAIFYKAWESQFFVEHEKGEYFEYLCKPIDGNSIKKRANAAHNYYMSKESKANEKLSKMFSEHIDSALEENTDSSFFSTLWSGLRASNDYSNELHAAMEHIHSEYKCKYEISEKIIDSVFSDDTTTLEKLIANGVSIDYQDEYGDSLLMSAIAYESYTVADWLLQQGADVSLKSGTGDSAISNLSTAETLNRPLLEKLIAKGADINHIPDNGYSLLSGLINLYYDDTDQLADIRYVLAKGAKPNLLDSSGEFLILSICYLESADKFQPLIDLLLQNGLDLNKKNITEQTIYDHEECSYNTALVKYMKTKLNN